MSIVHNLSKLITCASMRGRHSIEINADGGLVSAPLTTRFKFVCPEKGLVSKFWLVKERLL